MNRDGDPEPDGPGFEKGETAGRKAEEEIRKLNERYAMAIRVGKMGVWEYDFSTGEEIWDDFLYDLYGIDKNKTKSNDLYRLWMNAIHPLDRERVDLENRKLQAGQTELDVEFRIIIPDGTVRYVKAVGEMIRDERGDPARLIGLNVDITKEKIQEQALRDNQAETEKALKRISALNRIQLEISQADWNERSVNETAMRAIRELIPSDEIFLVSLDAGRNLVVTEATLSGGTFTGDTGRRAPFSWFAPEVFTGMGSEATIVRPEQVHPGYPKSKADRFFAEAVAVPVHYGDKVQGYLILLSETEKQFTPDHLQIAGEIGTLISINFRKRELLRDLEQHAQSLSREVNEKGREINTLTNIHQVILDNAGLAIISTDAQGVIRTYNKAAEAMLGYPAEEVIGKMTPDRFMDSQEITNIILPKLRTKEKKKPLIRNMMDNFLDWIPGNDVWTYLRKDGSGSVARIKITPHFDGNGNIMGFIGIARDISREKAMIDELKMQTEAFESFRLAIIITGPEGKILWANSAFTDLSGYTKEEYLGKTTGELQRSGKQDPAFYRELWKTILDGNAWTGELINRRKDGTLYDEEMIITPVKGLEGAIVNFIAIKIDITQRKEIEQSMKETIDKEKQLSRMKSKFISVASHEFHTPLSTILTNSEILLYYHDKLSREEQNDKLMQINAQVEHLNLVIEELLQLSSSQTKGWIPEPRRFDLVGLIRDLELEYSVRPQESGRISVHPQEPSLEIFQDRKLLRQVLTNLLSNSLKYSSPGTPVVITIHAGNGMLEIKLKDQGIGIPEEDLPHLFEPFFRASNAGNIPGTGLGLNIVREILFLLGGEIRLASTLNEGTEATVILPLRFQINKR